MSKPYFNPSMSNWIVVAWWQGKRFTRSFKGTEDRIPQAALDYQNAVDGAIVQAKKYSGKPFFVPENTAPPKPESPKPDKFWEEFKRHFSAKGTKTDFYRYAWLSFTTNAPPFKHIADISAETLIGYRNKVYKSDTEHLISKTSVNTYQRSLRTMLHFAVERGYLESNPFKQIPPLGRVKAPRAFLEFPQVMHLLRVASEHSEEIYCFLLLTALQGLRAAEALFARHEWIRYNDALNPNSETAHLFPTIRTGTITIMAVPPWFEPKNRDYQKPIPLHPIVQAHLLTLGEKKGFIILPQRKKVTGRKRWDYTCQLRTVLKKAGLREVDYLGSGEMKNIHAHSMRHSFVTNAILSQNYSLPEVMELARHKNIETTLQYTHVEPAKAPLSFKKKK